METVTSKDGTTIAFDRIGDGAPVVLVAGGSVDRSSNAPLADLLATDFTVLNYDRRGRGPSGDTQPYAVQREVEDIDAVIAAAGGSAHLYGTSSGAALALEAAASGLPITKLALWEPPFILDEASRPPADQVEQYERMIAEDRPGGRGGVLHGAGRRHARRVRGRRPSAPCWSGTEALAHTLAYDARVMGDYSLPTDRAASVTAPTIVLAGGADFPFMLETAKALADAIPNGRTRTLEGQGHDVDRAVLAPALKEFFGA